MNCATVIENLGAFADGERAIDAEVELHLASCAGCRAALEALRADHAELDAAFAPLRARRAALEERVAARARVAGEKTERPPRRLLLLAVAAAVGFLAGAAVFGPWRPGRDVPSIARLGVATGAVEVMPSGRGAWIRLAPGESIAPGSRVRTAIASKCSLLAADGSEVRLDASSEIRAESARRFELASGRIFAQVESSPGTPRFAVTTAEGTIEAVGTALDVERVTSAGEDPAHVRLTVVEGTVLVGAESIEAGTAALLRGGSVTRREPVSNLVRATLWVNEILALRGPDDAEFSARVNSMLADIGMTKMQFLAEAEIRALGDHCALPLLRHVQSPESRSDANRRRNAVRILADIAPPSLALEMVTLLEDGDGEVRVSAARALSRFTGSTLGRGDEHWRSGDFAAGAAEWRRLLSEPGSPFVPRGSR